MALIWADRVYENGTVTGTGSVTLTGAATGFRSFASAIGNANTSRYLITTPTDATKWEVGTGTMSTSGGNTLARTTVIRSSAGTSAVDFGTATAVEVRGTLDASTIDSLGGGGGAVDSVNGDTGAVVVDLDSVLSVSGSQALPLGRLDTTGATSGQIPKYNGTTVVWAADSAGSGGSTLPVDDSTALVRDPVDTTKLVRIDAGAVSTGTTRTITMPDRNVDLGQVVVSTFDVGGGIAIHNGISSDGEIYLRTLSGDAGISVESLSDGSLKIANTNVPLTVIDTTGASTGDVLTFDGSDPTWAAPSGGGGSIDVSGTPSSNHLTKWVDADTIADAGIEVVDGGLFFLADTLATSPPANSGHLGAVTGGHLVWTATDGTPSSTTIHLTGPASIVVGASSSVDGAAGRVPQPVAGEEVKFLRGDGTWATVSGGGGAVDSVNGDTGTVVVDLDSVLSVSGSQALPLGRLDTTGATSGQVLKYNGTAVVWGTDATGGGGGASNLDGLSDVVITSPQNKHALLHNGTEFVNRLILSDDARHGSHANAATVQAALRRVGARTVDATLAALKTKVYAWYDFNEPGDSDNLLDQSPNARHFAPQSPHRWVPGIRGGSRYRSAAGTGYLYGNTTDFHFGSQSFSIACLFHPDNATGYYKPIFVKDDTSSNRQYLLAWNVFDSPAAIHFYMHSAEAPSTPQKVALQSNLQGYINQWQFIFAGYDAASGQLWIQSNESPRQTAAFSGTPRANTSTAARIGYTGSSAHDRGAYQMLAVFDNYVLTTSDCTAIVNDGMGLKYTELG